jgi:transposase
MTIGKEGSISFLKKRNNTLIPWNVGTPLRRGASSILYLVMAGVITLTAEQKRRLNEIARDGLAEHRVARRANALILLERGMSYRQVANVLLVDDETVRDWQATFSAQGIDGLLGFQYGGRAPFLTPEQEAQLKKWVGETLPRTTRQVGAYIESRFGVTFESRSGLIGLLHKLGFEHRKPRAVSSKMDPDKQRRFIAAYEDLLNSLADDETVVFGDAVHPTYGAQPVGCWAPKEVALAVEQTTGREHVNIHGAIDLETGQTCMLEVETVNAESTIALLAAILVQFPKRRRIHVFLDNARCHHAKLVQEWLRGPGQRIKLHFIPAYCPHLNPIERLWLVMHKNLTHNKCAENFRAFRKEVLHFLRRTVPQNWNTICDEVTDNFRIRNPAECRILR